MISDPMVGVSCDRCADRVYVELYYKYHNYSGKSWFYDTSDNAIERALIKQYDWQIIDGNHYCCEDCANHHTV